MSDASTVARGTEYELFTQGVYQAILRAQGVTNISVKHNIKLQGKSGCDHQIDVYWEFELAGHVYRTAIECKAFNKEVSIGKIRDFYGVLVDIPNLNGIFATLVGYQSGARKYATHYGIQLQELRTPTEQDWKGRIRDVVISITAVFPTINQLRPKPTAAFLATINEPITSSYGIMNDVPILFDPTGQPVASHAQLAQSLPTENAPFKNKTHFAAYPAHRLKLGNLDMEIEGIEFDYSVDTVESTSKILGDQIVHAIIRDIDSGTYTIIDNEGIARKPWS